MEDPHDERAEELDKQADVLEDGSDRVGGMIHDTREDWDSKLSSQQAPGAASEADAAPGGLGEAEEEDKDSDGGDDDSERDEEDDG